MSTIILKTLQFSNMFSYGKNNVLQLDKNRITQLTAPNGSGKSSIILILQELLFGKNVKGIKKTDIANRWSKSKDWDASLEFTVDDKEYLVSLKRVGASSKLQLLEQGVDISEHKVLDTYKKIADILGADYTVFSQLTYQSSTDLLDFLKATDTNRKKFLINLFNLEKYLEIGDSIKLKAASVDKELIDLQGQLKTIESFLESTSIPELLEEKPVPAYDDSFAIRLSEINHELSNITAICKKIDKNNMNIRERDSITFDSSITEPERLDSTELEATRQHLFAIEKDIASTKKELNNIHIVDTCPACGQPVDNSHIKAMKTNLETKLSSLVERQENLKTSMKSLAEKISLNKAAIQAFETNQRNIERFEQLTQLIDTSIPTEYPNYEELSKEKRQLEIKIDALQSTIKSITDYNKRVSASNAKVQALVEQKAEFLVRQEQVKTDILYKSAQQNRLSILKKAFSPSGIVAFKLENLTKTLESTINSYLSVLSDGQFQIEFSLDKEKLNISVVNNGIASPIETVSGGEFSRIQTSILLAIRSLLSKLGGSSVNLLFLDEISGVLDEDGKEKLIEVLQREHKLNVFLVSHDFTHPLVDKIAITKKNNISSIQS